VREPEGKVSRRGERREGGREREGERRERESKEGREE
tara:strand:+ start:4 stop:114 length:111 start_codon:yes stop_codon:yes gene_type:complete